MINWEGETEWEKRGEIGHFNFHWTNDDDDDGDESIAFDCRLDYVMKDYINHAFRHYFYPTETNLNMFRPFDFFTALARLYTRLAGILLRDNDTRHVGF